MDAHEFSQAYSEALTTTIGVLGLLMASTFFGPRRSTRRSTKCIPEADEYQHVYGYLCVPRRWFADLPPTSVTWAVPREAMAVDTLQLETWWSDRAIVSRVLPQTARPARTARQRPRNNTHWRCAEDSQQQ
eukprot:1358723-Pyramimonas_sp.AAC.1